LIVKRMRVGAQVGAAILLSINFASGQILGASRAPSVSMSPAPLTGVQAGKPGEVALRFHVNSGFHINSNRPSSEFLLPTVLKLDAPTDIMIGGIRYPVGQEMSFPFAPNEKLSVYSGDFGIGVVVRPLGSVLPTKYMIHGQLKYQACDKAACYPPKTVPVKFEIKVAKGAASAPRRNPAQSPHAHR
jgi:Disulphide bond corrector protein DsbC